MAHDVFLSYSAQDKSVADAVCARLEAEGVRCWVAPRDILPGTEWGEAIITAIEECPVMVLILSAHSNDSPQVRREVERAIHRGVMIVPFRIEDVKPTGSMEYFLSAPHWLDAIQPPLEKHIDHLADTARRLLERGGEEGEAPAPSPPAAQPPPRASAPPLRRRLLRAAGAAVILAGAALIFHLSRDGAAPPVRSEPADGARTVPIDVGLLRLTFDRPMLQENYSVCRSDQGMIPALSDDDEDPWRSDTVFELKLELLQPHTTYAVQLNSTDREGFRYADTDEPLPITTIVFQTGGG